MIKRINFKNIIIAVVALAALQLGCGYLVSPALSGFIIDSANQFTGSKIEAESIRVWPVTLTVTLDGLKVFDPDNVNERIGKIDKAEIAVSPWALLSKRLVLSRIKFDGAEVDLVGQSDGSFNVQKLSRPKQEVSTGQKLLSVLDQMRSKKDLFGRIYNMLKKKTSKEAVDKAKQEHQDSKKVTKNVNDLPKGRMVEFKTVRSGYLFEIQTLSVRRAFLRFEPASDKTFSIDKANIEARGIAYDPDRGIKIESADIRGGVEKSGQRAGDITLYYRKGFKKDDLKTEIRFEAKNIDMGAVKLFYDDSLPVTVERGLVNLDSKTTILNDVIDSRNSLVLKNQFVSPKGGMSFQASFIPMPVLCDAINGIDPLKLKFDITGTVDKPEFSGFQDALKDIVKPYIDSIQKDLTNNVQKNGLGAIKDLFNKYTGKEEKK